MDVSFNGAAARTVVFDIDDLRRPMNTFTEEEQNTALLLVLKAHIAGMTRNQAGQAFPANTAVEITL